MRLWELEAALGRVQPFKQPEVTLEQYPTPVGLAARTVQMIEMSQDDEGIADVVCDLGCGTGMLSLACASIDVPFVVSVDVDSDAIVTAMENVSSLQAQNIDFVIADVTGGDFMRPGFVDTVVMNPPFGTKRAGVDIAFLVRAARLASSTVYSMHKSSTRDYVKMKTVEWGVDAQVRNQTSHPYLCSSCMSPKILEV